VVPVAALGALARERNILHLVDAAQTAGVIPIDVESTGVDLLAFSGHKGLLGPTGTGGLFIRSGVVVAPLVRGGTGSESAHEMQPDFFPDAYESGTLNVAGIAGLAAGVRFLSEIGVETIQAHDETLVSRFRAGASEIQGVRLYGPAQAVRSGVVSFTVDGASPSEVALILDESFGIMARAGLHCAPSTHRTLGTFPTGTVRFSFGWFNTTDEIRAGIDALREITVWARRSALA
jgi:selenocysteine lyase/cysteine desulfurase